MTQAAKTVGQCFVLHILTTCSASGDDQSEKQQKIDLSSNNEKNLKFKLRYHKLHSRWPKFSAGNAALCSPILPHLRFYIISLRNWKWIFSNFFSPPSWRKFPISTFRDGENFFRIFTNAIHCYTEQLIYFYNPSLPPKMPLNSQWEDGVESLLCCVLLYSQREFHKAIWFYCSWETKAENSRILLVTGMKIRSLFDLKHFEILPSLAKNENSFVFIASFSARDLRNEILVKWTLASLYICNCDGWNNPRVKSIVNNDPWNNNGSLHHQSVCSLVPRAFFPSLCFLFEREWKSQSREFRSIKERNIFLLLKGVEVSFLRLRSLVAS